MWYIYLKKASKQKNLEGSVASPLPRIMGFYPFLILKAINDINTPFLKQAREI